MSALLQLIIGILYAFFGIVVVTTLHYMVDDVFDSFYLVIFLAWPIAIMIILLAFLGFCAFYIGKQIGEWLNKKLFSNQKEGLI